MVTTIQTLPKTLAQYYTLKEPLTGRYLYKAFLIEHQKNQDLYELRIYSLKDGADLNLVKSRLFDFYKLSHRHLSSLCHYIWDDENIYLVFDIHSNKNLFNLITDYGPVPLDYFFKTARQICDVLNYLHQSNIQHLDLTPQSITLDDDGDIFLAPLYFDCLKSEKGHFQHKIKSYHPFVAPDCLLNDTVQAEKTDIYGLGALFYWLLTGKMPFSDWESLKKDILTKEITPIRLYRRELPRLLEQFVMEMLFKNTSKRPESVGEIYDELKKIEKRVMKMVKRPLALPQNRVKKPKLKKPKLVSFPQIGEILSRDFSWVRQVGVTLSKESRQMSWPDFDSLLTRPHLDSCIAIVDNYWYLFVYQGVVIGAVDLRQNLKNSFALDTLPSSPKSVKLQSLPSDSAISLVMLNQLLNLGHMQGAYKHTSSYIKNKRLEAIKNNKETGCLISQHFEHARDRLPTIYIHWFVNGEPVFQFGIALKDGVTAPQISLKLLWQKSYCWAHFLPTRLFLGFQGLKWIYKQSHLQVGFKQSQKDVLAQIEPKQLQKSIQVMNQELQISIVSEHSLDLDLIDGKQSFQPELETHPYYNFVQWLFSIVTLRLHLSPQKTAMEPLFNALFEPCLLSFHDDFEGDDLFMFSWNEQQPRFVAQVGSGKLEDFKTFVGQLKQLKKLYKTLVGAVFIASNDFEPMTLFHYEKLTEGSMMSNKVGFIRTGLIDGVYCLLVKQDFKKFELVAPQIKIK